MNETPSIPAIFQCEDCLRYFQWPLDGGAGRTGDNDLPTIVQRPLGVLPQLGVCGLRDCGALKLKLAAEERAIDSAGQARAHELLKRQRAARLLKREKCRGRRRGSRGVRRSMEDAAKALPSGVPAAGYSSCPVEREYFYQEAATVHNGPMVRPMVSLPHAEQVRAFATSAIAAAQNERMLELLRMGFDEGCPQVPGRWVSNGLLQEEGIGRPASRASDLRGTEHREPHAFVKRYGLDVDCSRIVNESGNDKEHYAYRLCLKGVSTRLQREQHRDERQGVLPAVEAQI